MDALGIGWRRPTVCIWDLIAGASVRLPEVSMRSERDVVPTANGWRLSGEPDSTGLGSLILTGDHADLRRFLAVAALMFWQGGFVFYAGVVVPVARRFVKPLTMQTMVTREVTDWMNLAGVVALLLLAWDAAVCPGASIWRNRVRWLAWVCMAAGLGLLACLHVALDGVVEPDTGQVLDYGTMRVLHRSYLWVSTLQWGLTVAWIWMTLEAWRIKTKRCPSQVSGRKGVGDEVVGLLAKQL
jgi:hypothetical protein